jgi:O-antigen/teichoic acid export membrane protein
MSILKNYSYNLIYQITLILIPVISIPYISRVIGSQGIGIYSYTNSINQYFVLFANMGLSIYASREIAYVKESVREVSKLFAEIVIFQFAGTLIVILCYFLYIYFFVENYFLLFIIQSISILSVAFDISWFYIGIENFKKNVIRNLGVKIFAFILLFLLVKSPGDLWKYVTLSVTSIFLGQIYMWIGIKKYLKKVQFKDLHFFKHLKKISNFFLIVAIGIVGVNLNKTLIGIHVNVVELGKYEMAYRIITMILIIVTSLGTVMSPRISATFGDGNKVKVNQYLKISLQFILFFCFLVVPLLIGISDNFISWFLGSKFTGAELYLAILSPMILINSISNFLANQYMIPSGNERQYLISLLVGGSIGILASLFLIPNYSTIGACVSVLIGEMSILSLHIYQTKGQDVLINIVGNWWQFVIAAIPVLGSSYIIRLMDLKPIMLTLSQIFLSFIVYITVLKMFRNEFIKMIFSAVNGFITLNSKNIYNINR